MTEPVIDESMIVETAVGGAKKHKKMSRRKHGRRHRGGDGCDGDYDGGGEFDDPKIARYFVAIIIILLIIIIVIIGWRAWKQRREQKRILHREHKRGGTLIERLYHAGWRLYATSSCPHCQEQLRILGGSYPGMINCDNNPTACASAGATNVPFWKNINTQATAAGVQSISALLQMANIGA